MNIPKNEELHALSLEELQAKSSELRRDLLQLRLKVATSHVKSFPSDKQKLSKAIARVETYINQKKAKS